MASGNVVGAWFVSICDREFLHRQLPWLLRGALILSLACIVFNAWILASVNRQKSEDETYEKRSKFHILTPQSAPRSGNSHILYLIICSIVFFITLWHSLFNAASWSIFGLQLEGVVEKAHGAWMEVFQVYKPLPNPSKLGESNSCVQDVLLMDHVFGWSYGKPFVGKYTPPACDFNHVTLNLTVTSAGRQFDRLAVMFLGDIEVFRTSTAEPTANGIVWTYMKDMSSLMVLWKAPQKLIFDLGNLVDDTYTGSFNTTLSATFSQVLDTGTFADIILPISSQQSSIDRPSAFSIPSDVAQTIQMIPWNTSRAIVSIAACGQATEEFWYSNALSSLTDTFSESTGSLYGLSPFREIQLLIDGELAGVAWPFPTIFTGGVAPGLWRPIVGIDAFDLAESQIDITPFLTFLLDGTPHDFEIRVVGLDDDGQGHARLSDTVGSYWVVTGKIFLFAGPSNSTLPKLTTATLSDVQVPSPFLSISSHYTQNSTGANETLQYVVQAERRISIVSWDSSWTQALQYQSTNLLTSQGLRQSTTQTTFATHMSYYLDSNGSVSSSISLFYPLSVNTSYQVFPETQGFSITASLTRGFNVYSHPLAKDLFPLPISPGFRSSLETFQFGNATYLSVKGNGSFSTGDTTQYFEQDGYQRHVRAVNGSVVKDDDKGRSRSQCLPPYSDMVVQGPGTGRGSVRAILGRGPDG